jgi:hydrogenase maturation protein HypF
LSLTADVTTVARRSLRVRGIVQGVGFRPFVYHLAMSLGLTGFVLNSSSGVTIEIEGPVTALDSFISKLKQEPPPLARIEQVTVGELPTLGESSFVIKESEPDAEEFVLVSSDVATCDDCYRDFTDPKNRRFGYPFTNCTNCGPRYTIIRDIPYDRPLTTMAPFQMCEACAAEYHDPADRRFHAQPNACGECGPSLKLVDNDSLQSGATPAFDEADSPLTAIRNVRELLHDGRIVAIRGLGGFHLACDAQNEAAVKLLRERKKRSDKPFAVMARDVESVEQFCVVSEASRTALTSRNRPIMILPRRPDTSLPAQIAPGNNAVGVMLPYTPLHYLLFGESINAPPEFTALVMTSGNISEEPIVTGNEEAITRLRSVADAFLFHNRDIYMRADDSVVRTFEGKDHVLRRSRAYVPNALDLGAPTFELLACGGELKNTFCLTKRNYAILSQHIGDLENYETLQFFEETLGNLKKLFRVEPRAVAHDLHPLYISTRYALGMDGLPKFGVQHHHAHIASCMAENGLRDKVIGVAFDGTGYGTDGKIWGSEFIVADFAGYERRAHFRYVPLPGGDRAIRQPWRSGLTYLRDAFGTNSLPVLFGGVSERDVALVQKMLERNLNTVDTSSCGRLFDAVASICGLRHEINFEGQAAIELEMMANPGIDTQYNFDIASSEPWQIDFRGMIEAIVRDASGGVSTSGVSAKFHNTLAKVIVEVCRRLRQAEGLNRVCLSGGTFQNMILLTKAVNGLRANGFDVYLHSKVPPNDGGIALGQAVIANELLKRGMTDVPGYPR